MAALLSFASQHENILRHALPGASDPLQTMVRARGADASSHLEQPIVSLLALGLFGDWGSGKSFFMTKLRRYISEAAA